jgi:AcrR family transcriptional regulator
MPPVQPAAPRSTRSVPSLSAGHEPHSHRHRDRLNALGRSVEGTETRLEGLLNNSHYMREPVRRTLTSDAAIRVISRDGIGAASLRRIAQEADVPLSSLNHVYPSKQDLLKDAWDRSHQLVFEVVKEVVDSEPANLQSAVSTLILAFIGSEVPTTPQTTSESRAHIENAQRAQYELYLWASRVPDGDHNDDATDYSPAVNNIETFLNSYGCPGVDAEVLSQVLAAMIDGLFLQTMSGNSVRNVRDRVDRISASLIKSCTD